MNLKLDRPMVFIDLETTGVDPDNDRIVELGALKIFESGDRDMRVRRINPGMPIPAGATEIHGITDADVADCPMFLAVARSFIDFIADCDIGGYMSNSYDVRMLYNEFLRAGIEWNIDGTKFIDVGLIYKRLNERTLARAYIDYCGKDLSEVAHSAGGDISATLEVLEAMLAKHAEMPADVAGLALYGNHDKPLIDICGKFEYNAEGLICFAFGKHKGEPACDNIDYLGWMCSADFPPDAKKIARRIIVGELR